MTGSGLQPDTNAGQADADISVERPFRHRPPFKQDAMVFDVEIENAVVGEGVKADRHGHVADPLDLLFEADFPVAGLVDEDQALGIKSDLPSLPAPALTGNGRPAQLKSE